MRNMRRYKYLLILSDILILVISVMCSAFFLSSSHSINVTTAGIQPGLFFMPYVLMGIAFIFISEGSKLYKPYIILKRNAHTGAVVKAVFFTAGAFMLLELGLTNIKFNQVGFLAFTFAVTSFLFLYFFRIKIITPLLSDGAAGIKNILVIGNSKRELKEITEYCDRSSSVKIESIIENASRPEIFEILPGKNINEIILIDNSSNYTDLVNTINKFTSLNITVKVSSPLLNVVHNRVKKEYYGTLPVVSFSSTDTFYVKYGKRVLDITGSIIGLLLLSPLFIVISVLIKVTSAGPVIFRQIRIGKDCRNFEFFKFRSMYQVKGEDEERAQIMKEFIKKDRIDAGDAKVVNTARVTKVGKLIRKTSVDELPQFYNVLKGDMSIVGARPEVPYVLALYEEWQKCRFALLPGCTGVWQVSARSQVTFNEMIMLDFYYIHNVSFLLDIKIILKTIPVMLFARGGR